MLLYKWFSVCLTAKLKKKKKITKQQLSLFAPGPKVWKWEQILHSNRTQSVWLHAGFQPALLLRFYSLFICLFDKWGHVMYVGMREKPGKCWSPQRDWQHQFQIHWKGKSVFDGCRPHVAVTTQAEVETWIIINLAKKSSVTHFTQSRMNQCKSSKANSVAS